MAFLAFSARLFRSVPIVLEIGDVVPVQVSSSWRGKCFRIFDKFLTARCQLIVTTTPKFLSEYYQKRLKVRTPGIVLENKVEADFGSGVRAKLESSPPPAVSAARICIGYFGLLGCPWAFEVLKTLVTQHPDRFEVVLSGLRWPTVDLDKYLASTPGFRYTGQFKSPQDLPALYGGVDVICGLAIPRSVPRIRICTGRGRIVSTRVACFVSRLFRALVHAMPSISRITKSVMLSTRSRFRMRMIISKKSHERQHREMEGKHALCSGARLSVHDGIRRSRVGDEKACRKVSINTVVSFLVSLLVFVDSNRIESLLRRHFLLVSTAQKLPSITLGASSK